MSLRLQMLLVLFVICVGSGYWSYRWVENNIRPQFLRIMEDAMVDQAVLLTRWVESQLPNEKVEQALSQLPLRRILEQVRRTPLNAQIYEWRKKRVNFRIYLTDRRGIVRLDTDNNRDVGKDYSRWNDIYRALRGHYGARSTKERNSKGQLTDSLYVAFPLYKQGRLVGALSLCKSKDSLVGWALRAQQKLWRGILWGATIVFLLALGISQWVLRPIYRLTQYARDVTAGRRVEAPNFGKGELGVLTQAFVEMKEALMQRQDVEVFVTQLTHELKSPISAIQGAAELLEDTDMPPVHRARFLTNIQNQTQRMNDIVQRLLQLISVEQQEVLNRHDSIDIADLLAHIDTHFRPIAEQRDVTLTIAQHTEGPCTIVGDRFQLEQSLSNLVQNSLHFVSKGGNILLCAEKAGHHLRFVVRDDGPGIPEYALTRVLDRFYSLEHPDTGQKGTGLGLPFVKQVGLLHGGDFSVENAISPTVHFPAHGVIATLSVKL